MRIFSSLAGARLYDTIGRYVYLFERLTAVFGARFYRFEHIETYSSGKVTGKVALNIWSQRLVKTIFPVSMSPSLGNAADCWFLHGIGILCGHRSLETVSITQAPNSETHLRF
jgi:hypothetical protein